MLSPNRIKPSAWLIYTNRCNAPTRQRVIFDRTSLRFDSNRSSPYHKANVVNNESPFLLSILLSYIFFLNVRRITASASLHARFLLSDSTVSRKYVYLLYSSSFFLFFCFFFFFFPRSSCVSPSSRETMVYIFVFSYFLSLSPRFVHCVYPGNGGRSYVAKGKCDKTDRS